VAAQTRSVLGTSRKVVVSVELEKELLALIEQGEFAAATTKLKQSTSLSLGKCKQWVLDHTPPPPPRPQVPCPYCGKLLRSEKAQQCFECGMDWHNATNVVKHGPSVVKRGPSIRPYNLPLEWLSKRASDPEVLQQRYPHDDALAELIAGMQPGDEIRKFESPSEFWQRKSGRFGYALVREGKPVSMVVLWLN